MRLTPADVHNVSFKKPSIGKRGYDEDEVDAFLDIVEAELAALIEENNELRQKVSSYEAGGAPPAPAAVADSADVVDGDQDQSAQENAALREQLAALQAQHAEVVQQAQQQQQAAAQQIQQAQQAAAQQVQHTEETQQAAAQPAASSEQNVQAVRLLDLAQETADRVTAEANAEAARVLAEANESSESTVADANAKAESAIRDSQIKAEAIDRESERKYAEVMTQLTNQRTSLESKIDALRTYEREYRTRLKGWITEQLQQLETTGAAPAEGSNE